MIHLQIHDPRKSKKASCYRGDRRYTSDSRAGEVSVLGSDSALQPAAAPAYLTSTCTSQALLITKPGQSLETGRNWQIFVPDPAGAQQILAPD